MSNQEQAIDASIEQVVQLPKKYAVVLKNDDFTPMDFVVDVLLNIFGLAENKAFEIMLEVHNTGRGIAGIYSREIAETKVALALKASRNAGHPFMCFVEAV